jgi:hypothetical protein
MQSLKEMIEQFSTGIKNWFGQDGSFTGKHLKPVFIYNKH